MFQAETPFILLECLYLIAVLAYVFTQKRLLCYLAYGIAGIKYSLSSLGTMDIELYQSVYKLVDGVSIAPFMAQEGGFTSALYIAKLFSISLTAFHAIAIVLFLISITFLFRAFLPKSQSTMVGLLFGFFPVGGELCLYLLRQLISTTIVFVAMGFLFRKKTRKAFCVFLTGFLFHSSTAIYFPLFFSSFFKSKAIKLSILIGSYIGLFIIVSNVSVGTAVISLLTGGDSLFSSRYETYAAMAGQEGWRDGGSMGLLTIAMILYFIGINLVRFLYCFKSKYALFYQFTLIMVAFQFGLEILKIFWISSRFTVIADTLLLSSNILISTELMPKKQYQLITVGIIVAIFWVSLVVIMKGYENYGLYDLSV
jgi:hypothetical protein